MFSLSASTSADAAAPEKAGRCYLSAYFSRSRNIHETDQIKMRGFYGKIKTAGHAPIASDLLTAIFLAVLAFLLYRFRLQEAQISLGINVIYIIACLIGGILAGKAIRQRRFVWGLLSGALYFLILLAVSFAMNRTLGSDTKELMTVFLMCAGSGTLGGMLS